MSPGRLQTDASWHGLNRLARAFARAASSPHQMLPSQYFRVVAELLQRGACNLLVVGAGRDSELYVLANERGKTVILEHNAEWIRLAQKSGGIVLPVTYSTRLGDGMVEPCPVPAGLPDWVLMERWDVIVVDGPEGYRPHHPGRQQSVFLASQLARVGTTLFVHDYERPQERLCAGRYLKPPDEVLGNARSLAMFFYADSSARTSPGAGALGQP